MKIVYAFAVMVGLLAPAIAQAQTPPAHVRQACSADARRLCSSVFSDTAKRQACMRRNRESLSAGCKEAVAKWRGSGGGGTTRGKQGRSAQ
jgi:hypothetical protein